METADHKPRAKGIPYESDYWLGGITHNLKDFPERELERFGIEAQDPDTFLVHQRGLNDQLFLQSARRILKRMKNPPLTVDDYLAGLRKAGLIVLASELEEAKSLLRSD
jgi:hypothetical protein